MPGVESVIGAEQAGCYHTELDVCQIQLAEASKRRSDRPHSVQKLLEESAGRFQYVTLDPFWWDAYSVMKERNYLSHVPKISWEQREVL